MQTRELFPHGKSAKYTKYRDMIVMLNALYIAYLDPGTTRALVPGTMNAETLAANADTVAHMQNGRPVTWREVTTEDVIATATNYPDTGSGHAARLEYRRRMGVVFPYTRKIKGCK